MWNETSEVVYGQVSINYLGGFLPRRAEARPFDNFFCLDGAGCNLPRHFNNSIKSDGADSVVS